MLSENKLNLLVVDDDQRYAERIVKLLSHYYDGVNLGFLDAKGELIKLLRQNWDVLIFGRAYDMGFTDVVGIIHERDIDLPLICLMSNETATTGRNEDGLPATIDGDMIKALLADNEVHVVIAVRVLHENLRSRREMTKLRYIIAEAEQRANILIKNSKSAVAYIDEGIHIFANEPYLKLFGFESMDEVLGVPVVDLFAADNNIKAFKQFLRQFDKGNRDKVEFDFESQHKDGSTFEAKLQLAVASFEGEPVTQVIIQRNTSLNSEEIAKRLADAERRDSLTGLLNRQGFEHRFATFYPEIKSGKRSAALLFIRIDGIGKISSNFGIHGVDAVVEQVGKTLDKCFDDSDVSRFSDTNFTVLLTDINKPELLNKANEGREAVSRLFIEVDKRTVTTTLTLGAIMLDTASPEPSILINRAIEVSQKAYIESDNVGNVVGIYDPSQHAGEDDTVLAEYIQTALSKGLFKLFYQPIYDIETDSSHFFEVYLKLPLADGTLMPPEEFLPIAKEHNLLEKIDRWVLINGCKQLSQVRKHTPDARILISLTGQSLSNKQLPGIASQLIKAVGGDEGALTLQFNEQDLVDYLSIAKKQFDALRQVHCGLSIYSFGSTAKTIDVMEYITPTMVRLARSYVTDLTNTESMEAVKNLVAKTDAHAVPLLMPYIEEASTMSAAWSIGARYLQGYYLQEPAERMVIVQEESAN